MAHRNQTLCRYHLPAGDAQNVHVDLAFCLELHFIDSREFQDSHLFRMDRRSGTRSRPELQTRQPGQLRPGGPLAPGDPPSPPAAIFSLHASDATSSRRTANPIPEPTH